MKSSRAKRQQQLAELRAARAEGKMLVKEVEEVENIYDEVTDKQYSEKLRENLDKDDFVVDDNGEGYVDDGREEWDREEDRYSESEDDAMRGGRRGRKCK